MKRTPWIDLASLLLIITTSNKCFLCVPVNEHEASLNLMVITD